MVVELFDSLQLSVSSKTFNCRVTTSSSPGPLSLRSVTVNDSLDTSECIEGRIVDVEQLAVLFVEQVD